jgi:TRAP-type mannitol/chloroaromatic compound transport system permease large subunit
MKDIYKDSIPFVFIDILAMAMVMVFPKIATFLPSLAKWILR